MQDKHEQNKPSDKHKPKKGTNDETTNQNKTNQNKFQTRKKKTKNDEQQEWQTTRSNPDMRVIKSTDLINKVEI